MIPKLNNTILIYVLCFLFFSTLIFSIPLNNIIIGIIGLLSISRKHFRDNIKYLIKQRSFLIFVFYILTLIFSLLYTQNLHDGIKVLERSATFLLFPLFIIGNYELLNKNFIKNVSIIFTLSIIFIALISLINCYIKNPILKFETFYRDNLTSLTDFHPMYFSLFVSLVGIFSLNFIIENIKQYKWLKCIIYYLGSYIYLYDSHEFTFVFKNDNCSLCFFVVYLFYFKNKKSFINHYCFRNNVGRCGILCN